MADEEKESLARAHLPFRAEYCKTSRAKCKKCGNPMEANTLKLANMTKSRFHDGYDATFYHVSCFFQIKRPSSVAEIRHFETLKYEDQKMLETAVETNGKSVLGIAVSLDQHGAKGKESKPKKGKKRAQVTGEVSESFLVNYDDFLIEYAKSGRAKCVSCEEKIDKDTVRIGKLDYAADTPWQGGPVPRWYHVGCFAKSLQSLEFYGQVDKIKNFEDLEDEDKKMVKKAVKPIKPPIDELNGMKKPKTEDPAAASQEKEEDKLLRKQSARFFKMREFVDQMKRKDIELMLDHMKQKSSFRSSSILTDMATDVLLFGPLKKCPQCKSHYGMELRGTSYICTKGTESSPCTYETRDPSRDIPEFPQEITEKYEYLREEYHFIPRKRIFPTKFVKAVEKKEAEDNNLVQDDAPLDGLALGIISWKSINHDKTKVQKKVTTLGGKLTTALDKSVFVILTSESELEKESPKVEVAKALDVPFATADFLFNIESKADVVPRLSSCLIGEWKGDLKNRFTQMINDHAARSLSIE